MVLGLFLAQVLLCVYGNQIFVVRANPFALILVSIGLSWYAYRLLAGSELERPTGPVRPRLLNASLYGLTGMSFFLVSLGALQHIWEMYPEPGKISDVLPQLQGQAELYFSGQTPYQRIETVPHKPYPVYLPLHWGPFQLANWTGMDQRWPGIIMLTLSVGIACFLMALRYPNADKRYLLPATALFAIPLWAFIKWAKMDLGVSSEGIVAAWYLLLAVGLAVRHLPLITVGIIGGVLSRYTFLFWLPLFALLMWLYQPRKYSFLIWGSVGASVLLLFVLPFLVKDPTILESMKNHYGECTYRSWVNPDEYTFKEALSLNIHLREWMPGNPEQSLPYKHLPQFGLQILLAAAAFWFYRKKAHAQMDVYTYALVVLSLMPMLFYNLSPMLFRYYMLMPLTVSALLLFKVLAIHKTTKKV